MKRNLDDTNKMMAQLEESNLSQLKEADELRSNIRELESARQESRREIQQLHSQVFIANRYDILLVHSGYPLSLSSVHIEPKEDLV